MDKIADLIKALNLLTLLEAEKLALRLLNVHCDTLLEVIWLKQDVIDAIRLGHKGQFVLHLFWLLVSKHSKSMCVYLSTWNRQSWIFSSLIAISLLIILDQAQIWYNWRVKDNFSMRILAESLSNLCSDFLFALKVWIVKQL